MPTEKGNPSPHLTEPLHYTRVAVSLSQPEPLPYRLVAVSVSQTEPLHYTYVAVSLSQQRVNVHGPLPTEKGNPSPHLTVECHQSSGAIQLQRTIRWM